MGSRSQRTFGVAEVPRLEERQDVDQRKHDDRAHQRAGLRCRATPNEGAVTSVAQDDSDHHFDVRQGSSEEEPREDLVEVK